MHRFGFGLNADQFVQLTGSDPNFYNLIPYHIPSEWYRKSPHALWGTIPAHGNDANTAKEAASHHPLLRLLLPQPMDDGHDDNAMNVAPEHRAVVNLSDPILVVDTDLRKQQEADRLTSSMYPHKLAGLHMVSGVGLVPRSRRNTLGDAPVAAAGGGGLARICPPWPD